MRVHVYDSGAAISATEPQQGLETKKFARISSVLLDASFEFGWIATKNITLWR